MQGLLDGHLNERKANILKGFVNDISKAEGDHGGQVIGHTNSGKPVYAEKKYNEYKDFSHADHYDAAILHDKESGRKFKEKDATYKKNYSKANKHMKAAAGYRPQRS